MARLLDSVHRPSCVGRRRIDSAPETLHCQAAGPLAERFCSKSGMPTLGSTGRPPAPRSQGLVFSRSASSGNASS